MKKVEEWYDDLYDEWQRLERHKIEFDITKKHLDRFVEGTDLAIFDIGGGPGRYAYYLAKKGHRVSLLDLSRKNIETAKSKAGVFGPELKAYICGNALELEEYDQEYDVILLMGPLYHLPEESDRKKVLEGALALLKPGGMIVATFISSYAPLHDALVNPASNERPQELLNYLGNGRHDAGKGFTIAYFSDPEEARSFMNGFGMTELLFAGVESILGFKESEIQELDKELYDKWIEVGYALSTDKNVIGSSQHLLYIGRK